MFADADSVDKDMKQTAHCSLHSYWYLVTTMLDPCLTGYWDPERNVHRLSVMFARVDCHNVSGEAPPHH